MGLLTPVGKVSQQAHQIRIEINGQAFLFVGLSPCCPRIARCLKTAPAMGMNRKGINRSDATRSKRLS
jgi:hypothetical protein